MDIRKIGQIKSGEDVIGNRVRVKVVKNKLAPPFRDAEFDMLFAHGISKEGDLIDLGVKANLLEKSGSWFTYNGERIGQGKESARSYLVSNPEKAREIREKLDKQFGIKKKE